MKRWSVNSFFQTQWQWPENDIAPLGKALVRRIEVIDRSEMEMSDVQLVTLRFDGLMEARKKQSDDFKGVLYFAHPNDVIYSRIDVRNGAIGVVPENFPNVAVSNEFPVYAVKPEVALPAYIHLLARTNEFLQLINTMISGASGRKRVQANQLEEIPVPLPSLETQRAIVERAQQAKADYENGLRELEAKRAELDHEFLQALGLELPKTLSRRRVMALGFGQMTRWDLESAQRVGRERLLSHFEEKLLGEVVLPLSQTNARVVPATQPDAHWNYIGMENVEARSGRLVNFAPVLGAQIVSASVVFDEQSLLYGKLRPYLRKVIIPADCGLSEGVASSEFLLFKTRPEVDLHFLAEFLRSPIVADYAAQSIGGRMPRVSPSTLLEIPIPVPQLETQRAIVSRLREGQKEIEESRRNLERNFKQSQTEVENRILGRPAQNT